MLPRTDPRSRLERIRRYGSRRAYLWRDGVRWRSRTYAELHAGAVALAGKLIEAGLRPGAPVLIQGPDHPDWVEALLGTFLAGGVAVPLEVATPDAFRDLIARRVEATILCAPASVPVPPGCRRIEFGSWSAAPAAGGRAAGSRTTPAAQPPMQPPALSTATLDDRAEIVFTSGTTGEPKGVVLTHANLAADFAPLEQAFLRREKLVRALGEVRMISTLPLSHMFGQAMNVFLSLYMGLTVALVPPRPRDILDAAQHLGVWGLFTVPRLMELLAAEMRRLYRDEAARARFEERLARSAGKPFWVQAFLFPSVRRQFGWRFRLLISGGAALTDPVREFWEWCGYLIVQGYGLTETAPIVSISSPFHRGKGTVGHALAGQEVRLGPEGEIQVRGGNVTSGYFGAEGTGESEWLRTGDVGEIDDKGRITIRGRLKDVIVTPEGENVYASDVETAFSGVPGVRDVCVFGWPYEGGERVHAALILETGADADAAVSAANGRLLPKQRVRDVTVWPGADFPRTATGKVRRMVVRERAVLMRAPGAGGDAAVPAGTSPARRLVARVARVPPDRIQATTRLVQDLGLASLDLVELAAGFEEEFGVGLPEERLAEATVADLERAAEAVMAGGGESVARAASPAASGGPVGAAGPQPAAASGAGAVPMSLTVVAPGSLRMPRWARRLPVHWLRRALEELLYRPIVLLYGRPEVIGLEHLATAEPPYLIVSNHHSYLDSALFKTVLPRPLRGRIAPGMTTRYHRVYFGEVQGSRARCLIEGLQASMVEFFFGAWPLPETAGFRRSVVYAGELADAGWSILIFPEGRHVPEGKLEPFRGGIGMFARDLRAPVIPVFIEGSGPVLPDDAWWPRFGRTRVVFGAPMSFAPDADAAEITARLEAAVRALGR